MSERPFTPGPISDLRQRIAASRQRAYDALKAHDFDLYRRCIQGAEAVTLTHGLNYTAAADCESAVILAVVDALGIKT